MAELIIFGFIAILLIWILSISGKKPATLDDGTPTMPLLYQGDDFDKNGC